MQLVAKQDADVNSLHTYLAQLDPAIRLTSKLVGDGSREIVK